MNQQTICIVGGTGFVGKSLVHRLTIAGYWVRVLTRRPERYRGLTGVSGVTLVRANVHELQQLVEHTRNCDAIINLAGILNETSAKNNRFQDVHVDLPGKLLSAAKTNHIPRLLHMSALNADATESKSDYLRSKGEGEDLVHSEGNGVMVTSFRPSVIFGPGDNFFNRFHLLLRLLPVFFPLACPAARFSPVYIGNVVDAFLVALENNESAGKRYDLCGPKAYSLQQLVQYTSDTGDLRKYVLGLGDRLSRAQAKVLGMLPGKLFTMDNYHSLQHPSVCNDPVLEGMGIRPVTIEEIVPSYLSTQPVRGRYDDWRRDAGRKRA